MNTIGIGTEIKLQLNYDKIDWLLLKIAGSQVFDPPGEHYITMLLSAGPLANRIQDPQCVYNKF